MFYSAIFYAVHGSTNFVAQRMSRTKRREKKFRKGPKTLLHLTFIWLHFSNHTGRADYAHRMLPFRPNAPFWATGRTRQQNCEDVLL